MTNDVTKQFIECLRSEKEPHFFTDTQFVSGEFLLTVLPSMEAETVRTYRLEFPAADRLNECPYPLLMLANLFDIDEVAKLRPRVSQCLADKQPLTEDIQGWQFRLWPERRHWVMEVEVKP